jgi:hypothetical protein
MTTVTFFSEEVGAEVEETTLGDGIRKLAVEVAVTGKAEQVTWIHLRISSPRIRQGRAGEETIQRRKGAIVAKYLYPLTSLELSQSRNNYRSLFFVQSARIFGLPIISLQ